MTMRSFVAISAIALVLSFVTKAIAQDVVSHDEWEKQFRQSIAIAEKLYPEIRDKNDPLLKEILAISPSVRWQPKLANDSYAPLFYATVAAQRLGISAQWDVLSDSEKTEAFQELAYHAKIVYEATMDEGAALSRGPVSSITTDIQTDPPKDKGYTILGGDQPYFVVPNQ